MLFVGGAGGGVRKCGPVAGGIKALGAGATKQEARGTGQLRLAGRGLCRVPAHMVVDARNSVQIWVLNIVFLPGSLHRAAEDNVGYEGRDSPAEDHQTVRGRHVYRVDHRPAEGRCGRSKSGRPMHASSKQNKKQNKSSFCFQNEHRLVRAPRRPRPPAAPFSSNFPIGYSYPACGKAASFPLAAGLCRDGEWGMGARGNNPPPNSGGPKKNVSCVVRLHRHRPTTRGVVLRRHLLHPSTQWIATWPSWRDALTALEFGEIFTAYLGLESPPPPPPPSPPSDPPATAPAAYATRTATPLA
eukprot:scaffold4450_cov113-Isochrysis_galbana.AAC.10